MIRHAHPSLSRRLAALAINGLLFAAPAHADSLFLPRGKAEVRHPSTGCEAFGPDFHKVDGSETCIRIGGSVRLETSVVTGGSASRR